MDKHELQFVTVRGVLKSNIALLHQSRTVGTVAIRLEAIATRVEAIDIRSKNATRGSWPYY